MSPEFLCREKGGVIDTPEYYEKRQKYREISPGINKQLEEMKPLCPECKIAMTHRIGPRGDFWGCSRFPECRQTLKMDAQTKGKIEQLNNELSEYRYF